MPSHISNPWNDAVSFIEMRYQTQSLATGSGFFWLKGRTFLVTNWHNLSGLHPATGATLSPTAGRPDRVIFTAFRRSSAPDQDGFFDLDVARVEVGLYDADLIGPRWVEHPRFGRTVDIGAIDITPHINGLNIQYANVLEGDADVAPSVSQDVFVVGFPFGLVAGIPIPVWKRASIATDPSYDPDTLPKVYVDTATREGMSGSIALARHILIGAYRKKDGTTANAIYAKKDQILGIYSGRLYPDLHRAQIGIVWKRHVIDEAIEAQAQAQV
jgi:hypothetical protein